MAQVPLLGETGTIGPCGSYHYNTSPKDAVSEDRVYASPVVACVFTAILQDWKKNHCPSETAGCRFAWGDISHRTDPRFLGKHSSHTGGHCIDILPTRTDDFTPGGITHYSETYDPTKTAELVALLQRYNASVIYFNDPKIYASSDTDTIGFMPQHHDHIHVCFPDNEVNRATCDDLEIDRNVCPELFFP